MWTLRLHRAREGDHVTALDLITVRLMASAIGLAVLHERTPACPSVEWHGAVNCALMRPRFVEADRVVAVLLEVKADASRQSGGA
jgi:hypothetical protein